MLGLRVRGKLVNGNIVNGSSWVYGNKISDNRVGYIDFDNKDGDYFHNVYFVIPDSLAMYTGCEDVDHTDIYQGDILKNVTNPDSKEYYYLRWENEQQCFVLMNPLTKTYYRYTKSKIFHDLKVVANITDNPLLFQNLPARV